MSEEKEKKYEPENLFYPWYFLGSELTLELMNMTIEPESLLVYKKELLRLLTDLQTLEIQEKTLVYFNIGARCEDDGRRCSKRQYPSFMEVSNASHKVIFLIDLFYRTSKQEKEWDKPSMLKYLKGEIIKVKNISPNVWTAIETEYGEKIEVRVYNVFFPTFIDMVRLPKIDTKDSLIERQKQSEDKQFISDFRKVFTRFVNRVYDKKGFTVFTSTATFKDMDATGDTGNLSLELYDWVKKLIGKPGFLILIWPFESKFFYIYGSDCKFNYMFQYCVYIVVNEERDRLSLICGDCYPNECDCATNKDLKIFALNEWIRRIRTAK